jgi:endonuclease YncB( thermonuclease family)
MASLSAKATVLRVIDGDTFAANIPLGFGAGLVNVRVRIDKINAPENSTPEGQAATEFIKGLVSPGDVLTATSAGSLGRLDNYGRVLAAVTLSDGRDWGEVMLEAEHATSMTMHAQFVADEDDED